MNECLWDTDVLSEFIKGRNLLVARRAAAYLGHYRVIRYWIITRYEIVRGLRFSNAQRQLVRFRRLRGQRTMPLTRGVADRAGDIWAHLRRAGQLLEDNDILIAATALHHGLTLATGNVAHFSRIPGLTLDDWTRP